MKSEEYELIKDFQQESQDLIEKMNLILEQCEDDIRLAPGLEEYGQFVDRIMGGSQSLAMGLESSSEVLPILEQIGHYSGVCKAVGYKTSQLVKQEDFYNICMAFLMDATEVLEIMTREILTEKKTYEFNETFISRLKWVSEQFSGEFRSSVALKDTDSEGRLNQSDIDDLLKKLGLG
jgi:hypothetical protein